MKKDVYIHGGKVLVCLKLPWCYSFCPPILLFEYIDFIFLNVSDNNSFLLSTFFSNSKTSTQTSLVSELGIGHRLSAE